jgi:hypothetical protein
MAQYLILIYNNEAQLNTADAAEAERIHQAHIRFAQAHRSSLRGGARLADSDAATTIRTDDTGAQTVTDGMFPETKEVLGGYYVVEAADLDEAIRMAKLVPSTGGGIEVRPIIPS